MHPLKMWYFNKIPVHLLEERSNKLIRRASKCCIILNAGGYRETVTLVHCWSEYKMVWLPWNVVWCLFKKLNINYMNWKSHPWAFNPEKWKLLLTYTKKLNKKLYVNVHGNFIHDSPILGLKQMCSNRINKPTVLYSDDRTLLSSK